MEIITDLVENQLILIVPVGLAIVACILVFTYAIRPVQQPKFKLSSLDDRKAAGKKKKLKEKKTVNGHVATGVTKSEKSPIKEQKKLPEPLKKEKKVENAAKEVKKDKIEVLKKGLEPQEAKKKTNKKSTLAKPVDFDEGDWETVPSKGDKKKKVEQIPIKKEKKTKAQSEAQSDVQPVIQDETPEIEDEKPLLEEPQPESESPSELTVDEAVESVEEPAPVVEEKKDKKKKKLKAVKSQPPANTAEEGQNTEVIVPQPITSPVEEPKTIPAPTPAPATVPSGAAFDELGDTWTEAKAVKKSKKKARRDN